MRQYELKEHQHFPAMALGSWCVTVLHPTYQLRLDAVDHAHCMAHSMIVLDALPGHGAASLSPNLQL